jgi:hypothetical protein
VFRTVAEVVLVFWKHAEQHYRHADGTPTRELADFKLSLTLYTLVTNSRPDLASNEVGR